jgi:hypothetical protein
VLLFPIFRIIFVPHLTRLFFILSLVAILLQTFSKGIILLSFRVNQEFIAQNLCVQKEVEDNCCKGSCQLKKQLTDDDNKSESIPFQNFKDKLEVLLFCDTKNPFSFEQCLSNHTFHLPLSFPLYLSEGSVSHPPPKA